MAGNLADATELVTPGSLGEELSSFTRTLASENVSENTIRVYGTAVRDFGRWLMAEGRTTEAERIGRADIEDWIAHLLATRKPATAHNRWRGLQRFFGWLAVRLDDDRYRNPMLNMKAPRLPSEDPRILTWDELRAVVGACAGPTFEDKRDSAIVRLLFDTGARRAEIANLRYSPTDPGERDIDLRSGVMTIRRAKGDKLNMRIGLNDKTLDAIEDYLRLRRRHPHAELPHLWLSRKGRLTDSGIAQMLEYRGAQVGIPKLHAHDFRHTATHFEKAANMTDSDIMTKRGWSSTAMLRRYASTLATERAIEATKRLKIGDKL